MATVTKIILTDDLDGTPAEGTTRFALDGSAYEIELNEANAARLRQILEPYRVAARPAGNHQGRRGKRSTRKAPGRAVSPPPSGRVTVLAAPDVSVDRDVIRRWAQANRPDLEVKDRGRVSAAAVEAYNAARGLQ